MVSHIARWYLAKLKSFPIITNVGSGVVLMSTGDVLAQRLESARSIDDRGDCDDLQYHATDSSQRTSDLGRYVFGYLGTMEAIDDDEDDGDTFASSVASPEKQQSALDTLSSLLSPPSLQDVSTTVQSMQDRLAFWKPSRTATMAAWCFFYTPFYVGVYKMYDRYLPKKTPGSIATRVALNFAFSVPINTVFYMYGTSINHTIEWYTERQRSPPSPRGDGAYSRVPYRFDALMEKTRLKIENELQRTVITSAACWVPVNLLTFSVVPSHLQPLSLMFVSMFWNCYLSMSQYRDAVVTAVGHSQTLLESG